MSRMALLTLLTLGVGAASACKVPVFRYALDRWPTAHHIVTLPPGSAALAEALVDTGANLRVVGGEPGEAVVRFPKNDKEDDPPTLWRGPAGALDAKALCHSPARAELVRQLASGTSVVWVLLDGDEASEKLLRGELARLEKALELPPKEEVAKDLKTEVPYELRFAVLKVRRDDAAEAYFVRQLLTFEDDEEGITGPLVVPVFGRGRALWSLSGEGLNAKGIAEAARYLCAKCSCEVKELNPGRDLLFGVDWYELLDLPPEPEDKSLPAPAIPPGVKDDAPAVPAASGALIPALAVGITLLACAAAAFWWRRRE